MLTSCPAVSYVAIIMAIGLYVDYILHILFSYYGSRELRREAKVKTALETVGISVLLGGLSTFCGAIPLALTSSDIFFSVFVAFVAIVTLGMGHGLILMPVVLSLVGPEDCLAAEPKGDELPLQPHGDPAEPNTTKIKDNESISWAFGPEDCLAAEPKEDDVSQLKPHGDPAEPSTTEIEHNKSIPWVAYRFEC